MYINAIESSGPGGLLVGPSSFVFGPYGSRGSYGTEDEIRPIGLMKAIDNADAEDIVEYEDLTGIETSAF